MNEDTFEGRSKRWQEKIPDCASQSQCYCLNEKDGNGLDPLGASDSMPCLDI